MSGSWVEIIPYGATITKIMVPDHQGCLSNCVLSYENTEDYKENPFYLGSTIGRCANRIAFGRFAIGSTRYKLDTNQNSHHLHGGWHGFSHQMWTMEDYQQTPHEASLVLSLNSPDGDQGYPGETSVVQKIRFDNENRLHIEFEGRCSKATPLNLTNHSYFNLSGDPRQSILDHLLMIPAEQYLSVDKSLIPTSIDDVESTPFNFNVPQPIESNLSISSIQTDWAQGFDHSFLLDKSQGLGLAAELIHLRTGRKMCVWTSKPAVHLYSGNHLNTKGLDKFSGVCFETQYPPDYPNSKKFSGYILQPQEVYRHRTIFAFSTLHLL